MTISYNFISLLLSIASLLISIAAACIAASSLSQAKRIANREHNDWKQRKWFDLYFEADKAYDALAAFQVQYVDNVPLQGSQEWAAFAGDFNKLMDLFRRVHSLASVFPINPTIDILFSSTKLSRTEELLSKEHLKAVFDAVQDIRNNALIEDLSVLRPDLLSR